MVVLAMESCPNSEHRSPGECLKVASGNRIRLAVLMAIHRDIKAAVPDTMLKQWVDVITNWPLLIKVMPQKSILKECIVIYEKRLQESSILWRDSAARRLQLLHLFNQQLRVDEPEITVEILYEKYGQWPNKQTQATESLRRPGLCCLC